MTAGVAAQWLSYSSGSIRSRSGSVGGSTVPASDISYRLSSEVVSFHGSTVPAQVRVLGRDSIVVGFLQVQL